MSARYLEHEWFSQPLPDGVEIGEGSWLHSSYAFLHNRSERPSPLRVGRHSGIYNRTYFELGPSGEVLIGDYCSVVGAIINTNRRVLIRDYALIAHEVVIADTQYPRPERDVAADLSPLVIGTNSWIGARALIYGRASIGEGAIVGAGAVVNFAVPDYAIVAGNPARVVGRCDRYKSIATQIHTACRKAEGRNDASNE